jgi:hypothetical protein
MDEAISAVPAIKADEPKGKFHAFRYWADVVKWVINLVGIVVDSIKANPFPKKDDYTTV